MGTTVEDIAPITITALDPQKQPIADAIAAAVNAERAHMQRVLKEMFGDGERITPEQVNRHSGRMVEALQINRIGRGRK